MSGRRRSTCAVEAGPAWVRPPCASQKEESQGSQTERKKYTHRERERARAKQTEKKTESGHGEEVSALGGSCVFLPSCCSFRHFFFSSFTCVLFFFRTTETRASERKLERASERAVLLGLTQPETWMQRSSSKHAHNSRSFDPRVLIWIHPSVRPAGLVRLLSCFYKSPRATQATNAADVSAEYRTKRKTARQLRLVEL